MESILKVMQTCRILFWRKQFKITFIVHRHVMKINHNAFQRNSLFGYIHTYAYIHDIIRVVIWFSINTKQKISYFLKTNGNKKY